MSDLAGACGPRIMPRPILGRCGAKGRQANEALGGPFRPCGALGLSGLGLDLEALYQLVQSRRQWFTDDRIEVLMHQLADVPQRSLVDGHVDVSKTFPERGGPWCGSARFAKNGAASA